MVHNFYPNQSFIQTRAHFPQNKIYYNTIGKISAIDLIIIIAPVNVKIVFPL
jgi:hypothetical protein